MLERRSAGTFVALYYALYVIGSAAAISSFYFVAVLSYFDIFSHEEFNLF